MRRMLAVKEGATTTGRFLGHCLRRFQSDSCLRIAAALSYSSLLAVVPLLAIVLGMFSAFPLLEDLRFEVQVLLFENLLPDAGLEISDHLASFVDNANKMSGFGMAGLVLTTVLLFSTITASFNVIWRVERPRSLLWRLLFFTAILTLGPVLIAVSTVLSGHGLWLVRWLGFGAMAEAEFGPARLLPFLLTTFVLTGLYVIVPNRRVPIGDALVGAVFAALLLEALKIGFGYYLRQFPTYQVIYGALAVIPIFLVWMYLSWAVILFGAEVAAARPEQKLMRASTSG